mmetsp:Transcript_115362/g.326011  ORF Transcript_115362/g.326011 Transcript_115362/m.326011 type:complete len:306 (+) Transcript_115362:4-921(+)
MACWPERKRVAEAKAAQRSDRRWPTMRRCLIGKALHGRQQAVVVVILVVVVLQIWVHGHMHETPTATPAGVAAFPDPRAHEAIVTSWRLAAAPPAAWEAAAICAGVRHAIHLGALPHRRIREEVATITTTIVRRHVLQSLLGHHRHRHHGHTPSVGAHANSRVWKTPGAAAEALLPFAAATTTPLATAAAGMTGVRVEELGRETWRQPTLRWAIREWLPKRALRRVPLPHRAPWCRRVTRCHCIPVVAKERLLVPFLVQEHREPLRMGSKLRHELGPAAKPPDILVAALPLGLCDLANLVAVESW